MTDHTAWLEQLWADHHVYLRNYLTARTRDGNLAEDLTAETFLRVLLTVGRYTDDNPRGLLVRIGTRLFLDYVKSATYRREEPVGDLPERIDPSLDPAAIVGRNMAAAERTEQLQQAVNALTSTRQRNVIRLDLAGATTSESCATLGINPTSLKQSRHHAIAKLRTAIVGQADSNAPRGARHPIGKAS